MCARQCIRWCLLPRPMSTHRAVPYGPCSQLGANKRDNVVIRTQLKPQTIQRASSPNLPFTAFDAATAATCSCTSPRVNASPSDVVCWVAAYTHTQLLKRQTLTRHPPRHDANVLGCRLTYP